MEAVEEKWHSFGSLGTILFYIDCNIPFFSGAPFIIFFFVKGFMVFLFTCEGKKDCHHVYFVLLQSVSQVLSPQNVGKALIIKVIFKFCRFS